MQLYSQSKKKYKFFYKPTNFLSLIILIISAVIFVGTSYAAQTGFERSYVGNDVLLSYQWENRQNKPQSLVFRLAKSDVVRGNSEFQSYSNSGVQKRVIEAMKKYAQKHSIGSRKIEVIPKSDEVQVRYIGFSNVIVQTHQRALSELKDKVEEEYLRNTFYMRYNNYVMPDHRAIARRYVLAMQPVAREVKKQTRGGDFRTTVDYILNFLQSIPYDKLDNRETSNGAGFQTPYGLLLNNKGDCDTKSVAFAALLRSIYPRQRIIIAYVPEHAFVGINTNPEMNDFSLKIGGQSFVLADPTGPRRTILGEVDNKSRKELERGRYSYQEVPF